MMCRLQRGLILPATLLMLAAMPAAMAAHAPDWLHALSAASLPVHDSESDAVLLYTDRVLTVQPDGQFKVRVREAYRILRPEGQSHALIRVDTNERSRVLDMRGWSIPEKGSDYEVRMRDSIESGVLGVQDSQLVSDVRSRLLWIPAARPGSLIGYEYETVEKPYAWTDTWWFQDAVPTAQASYSVQLPPQWDVEAVWVGHGQVPARENGNVREWTLTDIPGVRAETAMPPVPSVVGRLLLKIKPPTAVEGWRLQSWNEIGRWFAGLARDRHEITPAVRKKALELTAGQATALGKLRALAAFVQRDIRYVAIELGIGGYQPHAAGEVLAKGFGDCKDKVTLLSSMLEVVGIESYYVIVSTERGLVDASSPPNIDFDHMIMAIRMRDELKDPALLATAMHPALGQILYFDPTNEEMPVGRLSGWLQGGYGLLVTREGGELQALPKLPPASSGSRSSAHLRLDERGQLTGEVTASSSGDAAAAQRATIRAASSETDYIKPLESSLAASFTSFEIRNATLRNRVATELPLEWGYSIAVNGYAKTSSDLMLVRPRVLGSMTRSFLESKDPRVYPVVFDEIRTDSDDFSIDLPSGYSVESLPKPVNSDLGFAAYRSKTELNGNALHFTRSLVISGLQVPIERVDDLKQLYRLIDRDERAVAVLKRKP
jgi:transglutaminase-like putative cysteine protease